MIGGVEQNCKYFGS